VTEGEVGRVTWTLLIVVLVLGWLAAIVRRR